MNTDTDSDQEGTEFTSYVELDAMITKEDATNNYKEAGRLVPEEEDPISMEDYPEIMKSSQVTPVLQKILQGLALPYDLSDFQKLALHTLLQLKDLILISPTGSGKVISIFFILCLLICLKYACTEIIEFV